MKAKLTTQWLLASLISLLLSQNLNAATPAATDNHPLKPRLVILTDIAPAENEPDDMESMIRLLVHADLFEIEAIITTSGWNSSGTHYPKEWADSTKMVIQAYEQDLPNLMKRSGQHVFFPLSQEEDRQHIGY